jgi:hypothetical protein
MHAQVSAEPVAEPWPLEEQGLVALRPWLLTEEEAQGLVDEEALQVAQAALREVMAALQGPGAAGGGAGPGMHGAVQGLQALLQARGAAASRRRVVGLYRGCCQVADEGFRHPRWLSARLWVYEDGGMGLVVPPLHWEQGRAPDLLECERLEAHLV